MTIRQITAMMHRAEKLIAFYNRRYNFDIDAAKPAEQVEWRSALARWDAMKIQRDNMLAA